jgi:hypothetical protein
LLWKSFVYVIASRIEIGAAVDFINYLRKIFQLREVKTIDQNILSRLMLKVNNGFP